eukprot:scaffold463_cov242-Pinguiococcus_pyrenoidosus.AAC.14
MEGEPSDQESQLVVRSRAFFVSFILLATSALYARRESRKAQATAAPPTTKDRPAPFGDEKNRAIGLLTPLRPRS